MSTHRQTTARLHPASSADFSSDRSPRGPTIHLADRYTVCFLSLMIRITRQNPVVLPGAKPEPHFDFASTISTTNPAITSRITHLSVHDQPSFLQILSLHPYRNQFPKSNTTHTLNHLNIPNHERTIPRQKRWWVSNLPHQPRLDSLVISSRN